MAALAPAPAPPAPGGGQQQQQQGSKDELVPTLSNYVRGRLSKSEVISFAECVRALAAVLASAEGPPSKTLILKILNRMALFGAMPPSALPLLVKVRVAVDLPKSADRKLLRVCNYLVQVGAGQGSAGTVVPFATLGGQALPPTATDVFEYEALGPIWADAKSEHATHYQRSAAFRALAALARSSLSSDPDDLRLVSSLMAAVATTLDRCEAARRRKLPFGIGGGSKKAREADRRAALERVAAQRCALGAARAGLPGFVLSSKIAPRAFGGVNSPDAACARHALAVAAVAARDMPGMYVEQMGQLVANSLEIYRTTGSLTGAERAAAMAAAAAAGMPAPLRPTKELYQEKSLNLADAWARLYLARGCGAVVHSGIGNTGPFWEMLVLLACTDKSAIVALEAIKALVGAGYPSAASVASASQAQGGRGRPPLLPDEHAEADARLRFNMAWQLLMARADDPAPGIDGAAAAAAAAAEAAAAEKQSAIGRAQRAVQESAGKLAALATGASAGPTGASSGPTGGDASSRGGARGTLFGAIVSRLLACLDQSSYSAICSATRAVAVLAEARAHALSLSRSPAERSLVQGDDQVQALMQLLEGRMLDIASDPGYGAHQREKALEALVWLTPLPLRRSAAPLVRPKQLLQWMSAGGGTVSPAVRTVFADPWPEDVSASLLLTLGRRLLSAPAAAPYLLGCAAATASAAPSRVRQEQLHAMWDVCLRANSAPVKLAGVQAALRLMCAPTPAIAAPPSAAAPEVKALASREEAAMHALSRSAAWWIGENANFGAGEYAWRPQQLPQELASQLEAADGASQQQLAAAAVAISPVLSLLIARLQRVMVAGVWEVRVAAAQALAKIAVRSGEPFRVQCYSILAAAAGGSIAHRSRSSSRAAAAGAAPAAGAVAAAAAAATESAAADPLGIAAVAGPALEVLDNMYAGELVVEQLLARYGHKRSAWPKKLLKNLEARNAALLAAVCERVCFVPREQFWPLGNAAKELIRGHEEDEEEKKRKEEEEREAAAEAAAGAAAAEEPAAERTAAAAEREPGPYGGSSDGGSPRAGGRSRAAMLEQLQGYDYDPSARPEDDEVYPDDSISQIGGDDESVLPTRRGVALYDFAPEEEDEVAVHKGEPVDVEYEVGDWLQVIKRDGGRGLVPRSYVQVSEEEEEDEEEDDGGAFSLAGRGAAPSQADGYGAMFQRSEMRLRSTRESAAGSDASSTPYGGARHRQAAASRHFRRSSVDDGEDGGPPVDAAEMARMVALVAQQGGEVDRALEQVDELEAAARSGGAFNQPQYLHLKEALAAVVDHLDQLKLSGDARAMRRQMANRVLSGLDRLEAMRRSAMSVGGGAAPTAGGAPPSPLGTSGGAAFGAYDQQQQQEQAAALTSPTAAAPASEVGAPADEYYQPTKVRALFPFDAEAEGELTVAAGDELWVEEEVDGWYQVVRDGDGARGLVPASYVEVDQA